MDKTVFSLYEKVQKRNKTNKENTHPYVFPFFVESYIAEFKITDQCFLYHELEQAP